MKKALSLVLAILMVAMMAVTASAATVTVNGDDQKSHTFAAYQVFKATVTTDEETNETTLADVEWGDGIDNDNERFLAALKTSDIFKVNDANAFASCETAADVAEVLANYGTDSDEAKAFAKLAYKYKTETYTELNSDEDVDLPTGYYLIVDMTELDGKNDAANAALLQVVGDITINVKTDKPSVEKKVYEEDYANDDISAQLGYNYGEHYNDVADYDMGDIVKFQLYSKVPDMTYFDTYTMIFHDTMAQGLTLSSSSIKVTVGDTTLTTDEYIVNTNPGNDESFTVQIKDLKSVANVAKDQKIIVYYEATLNQEAEVGLPGNENKVYLEYSNVPDESGEGDTNTSTGKNLGKTPEDKVIVFTYALQVTKVEKDTTTTLKNAKFTLSKVVDGTTYYAVVTEGKIYNWAEAEGDATVLTTGEDGIITVTGIDDDGTYYLTETVAPTGYNKLKNPVTIVLKATTANGQTWTTTANEALTALNASVDEKDITTSLEGGSTELVNFVSDATAKVTIENSKGTGLPETGGIGTTVFYVVGGLLMLVAVVVLVARKKTVNEE